MKKNQKAIVVGPVEQEEIHYVATQEIEERLQHEFNVDGYIAATLIG